MESYVSKGGGMCTACVGVYFLVFYVLSVRAVCVYVCVCVVYGGMYTVCMGVEFPGVLGTLSFNDLRVSDLSHFGGG